MGRIRYTLPVTADTADAERAEQALCALGGVPCGDPDCDGRVPSGQNVCPECEGIHCPYCGTLTALEGECDDLLGAWNDDCGWNVTPIDEDSLPCLPEEMEEVDIPDEWLRECFGPLLTLLGHWENGLWERPSPVPPAFLNSLCEAAQVPLNTFDWSFDQLYGRRLLWRSFSWFILPDVVRL